MMDSNKMVCLGDSITWGYRQWLREYSETSGVLVVDFSPAMTGISGQVNYGCYTDEVHPSKAGYRAMTELFTEFYQNVVR